MQKSLHSPTPTAHNPADDLVAAEAAALGVDTATARAVLIRHGKLSGEGEVV